jgi:hypothetical protein
MQRYTIFFIVSALHVSSGFSAYHQELVDESELTHVSGSSKQFWQVSDAAFTVFELLMMSGETARNGALRSIKNIV